MKKNRHRKSAKVLVCFWFVPGLFSKWTKFHLKVSGTGELLQTRCRRTTNYNSILQQNTNTYFFLFSEFTKYLSFDIFP